MCVALKRPQTVKGGDPWTTKTTWVISLKGIPFPTRPLVGSRCHVNPANRCLMLTSRQGSCLKADCAVLLSSTNSIFSILFIAGRLPPPDPSFRSPGTSCQRHSWPTRFEFWLSNSFHGFILCCPSRHSGRNESSNEQQQPARWPVCAPCWQSIPSAGRLVLQWTNQWGYSQFNMYELNS